MRSLDVRSWSGSVVRTPDSMSPRRDRRMAVGVELMEARVSLSGFTVRPPAVIRGYEDPNEFSPAVVRAFNPQPDPPTRAAMIIAI